MAVGASRISWEPSNAKPKNSPSLQRPVDILEVNNSKAKVQTSKVSFISESMVIILIGYVLGIILPTRGGSVVSWAIGDVGVEEEGLGKRTEQGPVCCDFP